MHAANCRRFTQQKHLLHACLASVGLAALLAIPLTVGCNTPVDPPSGNDNTNTNTNTNTNDNSSSGTLARTCVGCHTDEALLRQVARVEPTPPPSTGEG